MPASRPVSITLRYTLLRPTTPRLTSFHARRPWQIANSHFLFTRTWTRMKLAWWSVVSWTRYHLAVEFLPSNSKIGWSRASARRQPKDRRDSRSGALQLFHSPELAWEAVR